MATILIIGASRGLGLGLAQAYHGQGWEVIGTARAAAGTGLHALAAAAVGKVAIEPLEITDDAAVAALRARLAGRVIDLLFVNAGVAAGADTLPGTTTADFLRVMQTNALAPMRCVEALQDLVPPGGMIAAMSSALGSVAGNTMGGYEAYRASKAALNTLMRSFAARHAGDPRSLVLIHPGWVRTDMGGPTATLGIEASIPGIVATLAAQSGRPGLRFLDYQGKPVPW